MAEKSSWVTLWWGGGFVSLFFGLAWIFLPDKDTLQSTVAVLALVVGAVLLVIGLINVAKRK